MWASSEPSRLSSKDIVDATKKSIDAAAKFDEVGVRSRAIARKLRDVQDLPLAERAPELAAGDLRGLDGNDTMTAAALSS
jgi:DNA recombination protein RmuC